MAVERNNQTRRIVTFFVAHLQDLYKHFTNNEQKRCEGASLTLYVTRCVHTSMNLRKMEFIS